MILLGIVCLLFYDTWPKKGAIRPILILIALELLLEVAITLAVIKILGS